MDWQLEGYEKNKLIAYMTSPKRKSLQEYSDQSQFPSFKVLPSSTTAAMPEYQKLPISPSAMLPEKQQMVRKKREEEKDEDGGTKRSLLRTLQLSQTRAREAEKKAKTATTKLEKTSRVLFEEYMKLYAHQQWVMLLEIEVSVLRHQLKSSEQNELIVKNAEDQSNSSVLLISSWCWTFAFCVGVAGVTLVLSRYFP